jgi:DNA-binding transcriptional regulator YhcF (GntR family)
MDFKIQSSRPIWQQLTEQLRQRIVTGVYPPGSRFPAVRELASEAGVNPNTMQRAMSQLETDELVITNRTLGRTVTDKTEVLEEMRKRMARERTEEYFGDMKALGYDRAEAAEMAQRERENGNGD